MSAAVSAAVSAAQAAPVPSRSPAPARNASQRCCAPHSRSSVIDASTSTRPLDVAASRGDASCDEWSTRAVPAPVPAAAHALAEPGVAPGEACESDRRGAPPLSVVRLPTPQRAPRPSTCVRLDATFENGERYAGHLLADVFEYRALRARLLEGYEPTDDELDRLGRLETALRPSGPAVRADGRAARRSHRWLTEPRRGFRLRDPAGDEAPDDVAPQDLGAGGMCVATGREYRPGQALELLVPTDHRSTREASAAPDPSAIRQAVRVAWAREGRVGLMFAGGPAWTV